MIYFLDTNFLISAKNWHFPFSAKPDFWLWLLALGKSGTVKIPETVHSEVNHGQDELVDWINANKDIFQCKTQECLYSLPQVLTGYGKPSETDLEFLKADPYVIAHAMVARGTVVTDEKTKDTPVIKNKKIPTVCDGLNIPCITMPNFMWDLRHTMP